MKHRFNPASDTPQNAEAAKKAQKKSKIKIITPTLLVFSTYALLLFSKIVDLTLLNRENEYYTVVILQLMIFASGRYLVQIPRRRIRKTFTSATAKTKLVFDYLKRNLAYDIGRTSAERIAWRS